MGFSQVYDYIAGKADWFAHGLPQEGQDATIPRVGDAARRDVPTCRLTDDVRDVRDRVRAAGWDTCLVVNDDRVVLGRLRAKELGTEATGAVEQVMEAGPTTVRPDVHLDEVVGRLRDKHVASIVVTTPDGRLVGLLRRRDVEAGSSDAN